MTTKNILLINGHPDPESFNHALASAYCKGVSQSNASIEQLNLFDLEFNPNLKFGYRKRTELEPDLIEAQEKIKWANHLVWVYPVWWGSVPAIMKGFIDRVFLPGFAFQKRENSLWWDKLLKGKSARIICTLDQPAWYYLLIYRSPSHFAMKKLVNQFVGIQKVKITTIGPIKNSTKEFRDKWLKKVEKLGVFNK